MRKEAKLSDDVKVEETSENESDVSQALAAYKRYDSQIIIFNRKSRIDVTSVCHVSWEKRESLRPNRIGAAMVSISQNDMSNLPPHPTYFRIKSCRRFLQIKMLCWETHLLCTMVNLYL